MTNRDNADMRQQSRSKRLHLLVRLFVLVVSIVVLLFIVDVKNLIHYIGAISPFVIFLLVCVGVLRVWLTGVRWRMVNPDQSRQLTHWHYFRFMMITSTFNLIMPGALGGDVAKATLTLNTVNKNRIENLIAILVDHFIGLFSIIILGGVSLFFISDIPDKRPFYLLFSVLTGLFFLSLYAAANRTLLRIIERLFLRFGRVGARLVHILETWKAAMLYFRHNYQRVLLALLLCLPIHCLSFFTTYILAIQLDMPVSFFDITQILALVWVITAIPLTISGMGIRELSFVYFLSFYGVSAEAATALSIYMYIVTVLLGFAGVFFIFFKGKSLPHEEASLTQEPVTPSSS